MRFWLKLLPSFIRDCPKRNWASMLSWAWSAWRQHSGCIACVLTCSGKVAQPTYISIPYRKESPSFSVRCTTTPRALITPLTFFQSISQHPLFHSGLPFHLPVPFRRRTLCNSWWPQSFWRLGLKHPSKAASCSPPLESLHILDLFTVQCCIRRQWRRRYGGGQQPRLTGHPPVRFQPHWIQMDEKLGTYLSNLSHLPSPLWRRTETQGGSIPFVLRSWFRLKQGYDDFHPCSRCLLFRLHWLRERDGRW